jgi:Skp family chaperone for outer membrane proteins
MYLALGLAALMLAGGAAWFLYRRADGRTASQAPASLSGPTAAPVAGTPVTPTSSAPVPDNAPAPVDSSSAAAAPAGGQPPARSTAVKPVDARRQVDGRPATETSQTSSADTAAQQALAAQAAELQREKERIAQQSAELERQRQLQKEADEQRQREQAEVERRKAELERQAQAQRSVSQKAPPVYQGPSSVVGYFAKSAKCGSLLRSRQADSGAKPLICGPERKLTIQAE